MSAGMDPNLLMQMLGQGAPSPAGGPQIAPGAPAPAMGDPLPFEMGMGPLPPEPMPEDIFDPTMLSSMDLLMGMDNPSMPPDDAPVMPREAPDQNQLRGLIDETVLQWGPRDRRMDSDLRMYRMEMKSKDVPKGSVVLKNTPHVIVEKIANMIAGHTPVMEMLSAADDQKELAEKLEKFLSWWWDMTDTELRTSQLYGSLMHVAAWFLAQRGWVAARMHIDPDATGHQDNPVKLSMYDPRTVYPHLGRKGLRYVVHRYTQTVGEVLDEWGDYAIEAGLGSKSTTQEVEVEAYYDDWWHAVWVDKRLVKPLTPHEYGFVPFIIVIGNGSPVRMSEQDHTRWTEEVGVSAFHSIRHTYLYINKILSQMATEVERSANPAMIYYWDPSFGPKPQRLETAPGAVNFLVYDRERAEPVQLTTAPRDSDALLDSLIDDLQKGGLPSVLWGGGGDVSGFQSALMSDAARDQVNAIIEGMEFFMRQANEMCLKLIRDWWVGEIGFWVRNPSGQWRGGSTITADDIWATGTKTKVRYKDISPRDRIQLTQTGLALLEAGQIDSVMLLEDYVGHENPYEVIRRARADMIYQDEDYMREVEIPLNLLQTDYTKFQWYMAYLQNKRATEFLAAMAGGGMPQMPTPALPPQGAPPGIPQGPSGFGAPPAPLQPGFDQMQHGLASALGGAGVPAPVGVPGIPGVPVSPMATPIG